MADGVQREVTPWEEAPRESVEAAIQRVLQAPSEQAGRFVWQVDGSPTPNSLRIAPVYTPPQHRRHGYASACTAAACRYILDSGKSFVTLFADLANPTSNHVYQAIGFEPVCDAEMIRFAGR